MEALKERLMPLSDNNNHNNNNNNSESRGSISTTQQSTTQEEMIDYDDVGVDEYTSKSMEDTTATSLSYLIDAYTRNNNNSAAYQQHQEVEEEGTATATNNSYDNDDSNDLDQIHTVDYNLPYERNWPMTILFVILCIVSLGVLPLLCHWFPYLLLILTHRKSTMKRATAILSQSSLSKQQTVSPVKKIQLPVEDGTISITARVYHYRHVCFIYDERVDTFIRIRFNSSLTFSQFREQMMSGVSTQTRMIRKVLFGENGINIQIKNPIVLLLDEVLHPFYLFQAFSIVAWCLVDYYLYSAVIFLSSALSALLSLIETRKNLINLRDMTKHSCDVNRYYMYHLERANSNSLVPGDVIEIEDGMELPCDVLLLSGECVMNESMLTGESVPVVKGAIPKESTEIYSMEKHKNVTLFAGTHVLQTKPTREERVLGLCVRTGFDTAKGKLVLSILFPRPSEFRYYRDAFRFVGVLFIISCIGMVYSSIRSMMLGVKTWDIILRQLNLVTIAVPPALPVAITVGTALAISRLKRSRIFTISPARVNVAGAINCMCFDKTGTLTEDGLDLNGVRVANDSVFGDFIEADNIQSFVERSLQGPDNAKDSVFIYAMASCHSLTYASDKLIGDPLEHSIFEATRWELVDSEMRHGEVLAVVKPRHVLPSLPPMSEAFVDFDDTSSPKSYPQTLDKSVELGIIRRYDFSSDLKRMAVLVKNFCTGHVFGIVKGSPEHLKPLCIPSSIPNNFDECLFDYAYKGFRVLACAYKPMGTCSDENQNHKYQVLAREQVESELIFLGFIVMQNKMKHDTPPTIHLLSSAAITNIMVTGDNSLTASYVARQSGIVQPDSKIYLGDVTHDSLVNIKWKDIESDLELDPHTLKPLSADMHEYDLAITGSAFEVLFTEFIKRDPQMDDPNHPPIFHRLLTLCRIYSRMSPDQKRALSEELQKIDYFVGFCGDGANDTASLKASHIGVSLSQAEASIAAPFTSLNPTIASVPTVIKEGRASLATSFQMFKYMTCYSLIQFFCVIMLYEKSTTLGNYQFLFVDLLVILPIIFLLSKTEASDQLGKARPSGSLLNPIVFTSLVGQMALAIVFMLLTFFRLKAQSWYIPLKPTPEEARNILCFETTSLFFISTLETFNLAFAYSISKPFKKPLYTNKIFCFVLALLAVIQFYVIAVPDKYTRYWLEVMEIPWKWKIELLGYAALHLILSYVFERVVIAGPGKRFIMALVKRRIRVAVQNMHNTEGQKRMNKLRLSKKKYNQIRYKMIMGNDVSDRIGELHHNGV